MFLQRILINIFIDDFLACLLYFTTLNNINEHPCVHICAQL